MPCPHCNHAFFLHDKYGCKYAACECGHDARKSQSELYLEQIGMGTGRLNCMKCSHHMFEHDKYGCKRSSCDCRREIRKSEQNLSKNYLEDIGVGTGILECMRCNHHFFEHDKYGCKHSACECGKRLRKPGTPELMWHSLTHFAGGFIDKKGDFLEDHDKVMKSNVKHSVNASIGLLLLGIVVSIAGVFWADYAVKDIQTSEVSFVGLRPSAGAFAYITFPLGIGIVLAALGIRGIHKYS